MKRYTLFLIFLFANLTAWAATDDEEELIIEMHGPAVSAKATPTMWDYTAPQLTRQLRQKTREQVLYAMPVVSDKDYIIRSKDAEYALIEYDKDENFRKFLFRAETPQTFVAAAATVADVLAVNKKYGINIGLRRKVFEQTYTAQATAQHTDVLPENLVLYHMSYTDINTPKPQDHWFLFENKKLIQTFYTQAEKDDYMQAWQTPSEPPATAAQTASNTTRASSARNPAQNTPRKALLSGGTVRDQMYMPRVTASAFKPATPTATRSAK